MIHEIRSSFVRGPDKEHYQRATGTIKTVDKIEEFKWNWGVRQVRLNHSELH